MTNPKISLLITDLDNTLFDWVGSWYASYSALIEVLSSQSGIDKEQLYTESQQIFQKYQTSEYAFLIENLPSLKSKHPGEDLTAVYADAVAAYGEARRRVLQLYPSVMDTLREIRATGALLVGYTESMRFYTLRRVKNLGLDGVLDFLFTQDEHELPEGIDLEQIRKYPAEAYELQGTVLRTTPLGEVKPSARILAHIISEVGGISSETAYVGDNLAKDVLMAQTARITDVHAEYGQSHTREEYELLKRVTHWTPDQVAREQELSSAKVSPTFVLKHEYKELLQVFEFKALKRNLSGIPSK